MAAADKIEASPLDGFDVTKTAAFQQMLEEAVNRKLGEALAPFQEKIASARPGETVDVGALDSGGAETLLQRLAHLIADVSDQGSGRPARLPPEVVARREASRRRMVDCIAATRERVKALWDAGRQRDARNAMPRYRAMTKMWLNERMIEPFRMDPSTRQPTPVEFYWDGPPNQAMRPINEAALEIFGHYRDWIGGVDTGAAKPGFISPKGIVILVGEKYSPPITNMQKTGFTPDFGDLQTDTDEGPFENKLSLEGEPNAYGAHGVIDPRSRTTNILGTVMAPAVQNQPNDTVRRGF